MSDRVSFTLQIEAPDETALEKWAIAHLEERGFSVARPHENWETVRAFCKRLRITYMTFARNKIRPGAPNVVTRNGHTGRVIEILSNPAFDAFITANKRRLHRQSEIVS